MAHKLFIGGLPFSTSSERLREVFTQAGGVQSATVVMEQGTGRSRGFGFVERRRPKRRRPRSRSSTVRKWTAGR